MVKFEDVLIRDEDRSLILPSYKIFQEYLTFIAEKMACRASFELYTLDGEFLERRIENQLNLERGALLGARLIFADKEELISSLNDERRRPLILDPEAKVGLLINGSTITSVVTVGDSQYRFNYPVSSLHLPREVEPAREFFHFARTRPVPLLYDGTNYQVE